MVSDRGLAPQPELRPPKSPRHRVIVESFCREPKPWESCGSFDHGIPRNVDGIIPNKAPGQGRDVSQNGDNDDGGRR